VTIIAGFKSSEGIVVCADTQETVGELLKRNVPKLRFEPSGRMDRAKHALAASDMAVAFCGSSENGPFIDKIVDRAWHAAKKTTSLDEACEEIERSIKATYKEFGKIYQAGYCPTAELIYGVKRNSKSKLFHASGSIVNETQGYSSGGIGMYMADFLASRMYRDHLTIRQCVILAAYILFQAKEHIEGCGGHSMIAVLRNDDTSGVIGLRHTETFTNLVQNVDHEIGSILLKYADLEIKEDQFKEAVTKLFDRLITLRGYEEKELVSENAFWEGLSGGTIVSDDLGLAKTKENKTPI
jgi:hypothetical protein